MKEQNEGRSRPVLSPRFAAIFARDVSKAIAALEEILARGCFDEEAIRVYTLNVHGMKGALANLGYTDLSVVAKELEQTGRNNNTDVMAAETPAFIDSLKALLEELTTGTKEAGSETAEEDMPYLLEKLSIIKTACETFDKRAVSAAITDLQEKVRSKPVKEMLTVIADHLLHSDFDEIESVADKFIAQKSM